MEHILPLAERLAGSPLYREPRSWDQLSHSYVSFWDVIPYSVHSFWFAMQLLEQEAGCCFLVAKKNPEAKFPREWDERFTGNLGHIHKKCADIQSDAACRLIERILGEAEQGQSLEVINNKLHTLKGVIEDDVKARMFSYIPQQEWQILLESTGQWQPIWEKFASTKLDGEQGLECYAHGLYTACVFHMMMVLERGLAALSGKLGIKNPKKDWGSILREIEDAIHTLSVSARMMPKGTKPPSPRTAHSRAKLLSFCSEAAKEFTYFKDAWRNHVSHGRAKYGQPDAFKVMTHVRDFMLHLATELKENPGARR